MLSAYILHECLVLSFEEFRQFTVVFLRVEFRRHAHKTFFQSVSGTLALVEALGATLTLWHITATLLLITLNRNDLRHDISLFVCVNTTYHLRICQNSTSNQKTAGAVL